MSAPAAAVPAPTSHRVTRERLVTALIFALLAHGVILLGVGFVSLVPKPEKRSAVAVTLVRTTKVTAPPRRADYLAQANQRGPGNTRRAEAPEPAMDSAAPFPEPGRLLAQALMPKLSGKGTDQRSPTPQRTHSGRHRMVTTSAASRRVDNGRAAPSGARRPVLMTRLTPAARRHRRVQGRAVSLPRLHGSEPRKRARTANARASVFAPYLESWRARIESIGRAQFARLVPPRVRRGTLTLAVSLNSDGTIRSVDIARRSRHPALNAAALKIIRLAAPFAPFPPKLRRETDVLSFTYQWNFIRGGGSTGTVGVGRG